MSRAVLLTGGNLGPVADNMTRVREYLACEVGPVVGHSSVRESAPWGFEAEERFLNQVLLVETRLSPMALLDSCQAIERRMGRVRHAKGGYASRTMDIDILFYDDLQLHSERLTLPHPLIDQRLFVLVLLDEVMPDRRVPPTQQTVHQLVEKLAPEQQHAVHSAAEVRK